MKPQRLSGTICFACSVVFLMQSVGYLSPAWFLEEFEFGSGTKSVHVDGIWWRLPGTSDGGLPSAEFAPEAEPDSHVGSIDMMNADGPPKKREKRSEFVGTTPNSRVTAKGNENKTTRSLRLPSVLSEKETETRASAGTTAIPKARTSTGAPLVSKLPAPRIQSMSQALMLLKRYSLVVKRCSRLSCPVNGNESLYRDCMYSLGVHVIASEYIVKNYENADSSMSNDKLRSSAESNPPNPISNPNPNPIPRSGLVGSTSPENMSANFGRHIAYMSAGMWYGRLCINSLPTISSAGTAEHVQRNVEWCALYVRTSIEAPEEIENLFEIRLEASIGLGFSLVGLLVSSSCCCTSRHFIKRTVLTLGALFISGAVMAIPVVYTVLHHVTDSAVVARRRDFDLSPAKTFKQHDLFDKWSAILCGVSSILAMVLSLVFTCCAKCSNETTGNRYKFRQTGDQPRVQEKQEIPINWLRNSKGTVSSMASLVDETKVPVGASSDTDTKSDLGEAILDQTSARDGGDSQETVVRDSGLHDDEDTDDETEAVTNFAFAYSDQDIFDEKTEV